VEIRPRTEADIEACVAMALEVHHLDRYPIFLPDDLHAFLVNHSAAAAWVADEDGVVIGHVTLHRSSQPAVVDLACEVLGCDPDQLGVVARLMVAPNARRLGIAQALIDVATEEARATGLHPMLDVVTDHVAAIALYERLGWTNVGVVTAEVVRGHVVEEIVFLAPEAKSG
jgi:GNAT superfamily N-acetyltransferase